MTRQPALEKRITVAWPMPRLAPVRSSVRRGVLLDEEGINGSFVLVMPGLVPGIHVFLWRLKKRRGWPGQARPGRIP
jgi:hypothetical protein